MTPTTIKSGDTSITFTDVIMVNGVAFSLTGSTVQFVIRPNNGGAAFTAAGVPDADQTANPGKVTYQPSGSFPTSVGLYNQEWKTTITSSGKTFHSPEDGYNIVRIAEALS